MAALDEGLTGQHLLQQAGKDMRGHFLRVQRICRALGGVRLHRGIVPTIELSKGLDLSFAYREHQRRVGQGLLLGPKA
ncbi:hypothetical protein J2Z21_009613 [Streptomyces griseochromogenes]|uniref:Uncharacterized protein n=1 Tax=Streptomyces griseochromogenes TaxID=68214 RepID=A0ABS4MAA0_9ACTN|nr:hypothetical protein [Streptomyces griseochromogenes]MBP2056594.1 hypothetical protein [Streptomyces griseochromogenes]